MKVKKRQHLCSQVSLCRLQQREENVRVDKLACVGYVSEKKVLVSTSWPAQAAAEARKHLRG